MPKAYPYNETESTYKPDILTQLQKIFLNYQTDENHRS